MPGPKKAHGQSKAQPHPLLAKAYPDFVKPIRDYAIFALDAQGHVLSWNDGAALIKGYTETEILGEHFSRFYPQEQIDRGWPQHELQRAAADGRFEDESWRVRKDGSEFWASVVITAIRDEAGTLLGYSKVTRDLTERRAHEQALKASEERFRRLITNVRDYAIFMLDVNGLVVSWNLGAESLKGYRSSEIIGSHISRFYTADAVSRGWPEQELRLAAVEGRFEDEGWRVRKDGSRFWANVVLTAIRDEAGTLVGFSKITRDLTERKRHEQDLARSEEKFRLLVEGVTDYAIVLIDSTGIINSWNSGAKKITAYTAVEAIGKHFSSFYRSEDIASSKPWQQLVIARELGRFAEDAWRVRKDGTQFWAGSVLTALGAQSGTSDAFVLVVQDLTERRHAENLADATKRIHEFIAMLAHELRNPLAPIRNAVELMAKKDLARPAMEAMRQTIDRQSTHLIRIVDELLDVNRIARGQFSINAEIIDFREVLNRTIETCRPHIDKMGHTLSIDIPAQAVPIRGDAIRLTQALVNLLNNAARYTPSGGRIGLQVGARKTDVIVRVTDNGKGIERENLENVFDLFTQLDPQASAHQGGLGVGLALVRRVVELHAGTVTAVSEGLGKGSAFTVRLPLSIERLEVASVDSQPAQAPLPRLRVLIADDNKDAADSLQMLVEGMGQDVYAVYDGRTALEALQEFRPHIVMLDIGMPGMSGYDVADQITARFGGQRPLVVAITGWGQEADKREAKLHGFNHHFIKPISESALYALLAEVAADSPAS